MTQSEIEALFGTAPAVEVTPPDAPAPNAAAKLEAKKPRAKKAEPAVEPGSNDVPPGHDKVVIPVRSAERLLTREVLAQVLATLAALLAQPDPEAADESKKF